MAKAKKSSTSSAPTEDENIEVTTEVAEAIAGEKTVDEVQEPVDDPSPDVPNEEIAGEPEVEEKTEPEPTEESTMDEAKEESTPSVAAETHSKKRSKKSNSINTPPKKTWWQSTLIISGLVLTLLIFVAGGFSQFYKGKVLPNVYVAGVKSSSKSQQEVQKQLDTQVKTLKIVITDGKTEVTPSLKEIGYSVDTKKTAQNAIQEKRIGPLSRFMFWQKQEVPAVVTVNNTLLNQYVENKLPKLTNNGTDARLEFDVASGEFVVTSHKDGSGPDTVELKERLEATSKDLSGGTLTVVKTKKPAKITKEKLNKIIDTANELLLTNIILEGSAGTFQAQPVDIAGWITPTPQQDGTIKLVVDEAKVESYVEAISNQISSSPQDKKVVKDKKTGKEVVLQEGRDGTELADREGLAAKIAQAVNDQQSITLSMNIKTAKAKVVNLQGYDKWIEVDLTKQTTTAYEHATALKTFVIASGLPGYDTPTGEYAIWLKVRAQTMQGGSKADGSYYNLPNVEWVSYFYQDYALHGAYWRKVWGVPGSHGCVNMTNADAQWIYNWAPVGTKVIVHY